MGVWRSQTVGYGVAGTYEDWGGSDLPGKLKGLDKEELQNLELPEGLTLDTGGDQMSGPSRWALLLTKTVLHTDQEDYTVLTKLESPTLEDAELLNQGLDLLGLEPDWIGWHFFSNVS